MDGMTLCGGYPTSNSNTNTCITFKSGKWGPTTFLSEKRGAHTSWYNKEEGKIILMGGNYNGTGDTTETITEGKFGGVPGFTLKYNTQ